jgi:hypothetical protein
MVSSSSPLLFIVVLSSIGVSRQSATGLPAVAAEKLLGFITKPFKRPWLEICAFLRLAPLGFVLVSLFLKLFIY